MGCVCVCVWNDLRCVRVCGWVGQGVGVGVGMGVGVCACVERRQRCVYVNVECCERWVYVCVK